MTIYSRYTHNLVLIVLLQQLQLLWQFVNPLKMQLQIFSLLFLAVVSLKLWHYPSKTCSNHSDLGYICFKQWDLDQHGLHKEEKLVKTIGFLVMLCCTTIIRFSTKQNKKLVLSKVCNIHLSCCQELLQLVLLVLLLFSWLLLLKLSEEPPPLKEAKSLMVTLTKVWLTKLTPSLLLIFQLRWKIRHSELSY